MGDQNIHETTSQVLGNVNNNNHDDRMINIKPNREEPTSSMSSEPMDEDVCAVCLEKPAEGCCIRLWCCSNVLCVNDAQQVSRCPLCRMVPLVWDIVK
ncbi:unnamed protein product [Phytomonas sp. Hart1]|nr:unnamed protein product [Phytomonas sp. Hart1]|eukprot:CCW69116.1 unnamed protein product [Phytomonas sp. isolate Hart1]